ncbi:MAG TPA: hypothetical protein DEA78_05265 [Cyanobacteria bacterium UBA11159]|nr:hypothetical protein [Cyanobacteria bacterium UBA11159]
MPLNSGASKIPWAAAINPKIRLQKDINQHTAIFSAIDVFGLMDVLKKCKMQLSLLTFPSSPTPHTRFPTPNSPHSPLGSHP